MKISELPPIELDELTQFRVGPIRSARVLDGPINFQSFECDPLARFTKHSPKSMESQLLRIKDGIFVGGTQNVISLSEGVRFNLSILDHIHTSSGDWPSRYASFYETAIPHEAVKLSGKVLLLKGTWSSEFFHFLIEVIGKILLTNMELPITEFDSIIIDAHEKPFIRQWMEMLGVKKESLKDFGNLAVIAEELYVPTYLAPCGSTPFALIQFVNHIVRQTSQLQNLNSRSKKIYIQRHGKRKVLHEDYLIDEVLHSADIEKVTLENLHVLDQIDVILNAKLIIAPHGAGLANSLFFNGTVLEILGNNYNNVCFAEMAAACGNRYYYHTCREVAGDLIVNPTVIRKFISEIEF